MAKRGNGDARRAYDAWASDVAATKFEPFSLGETQKGEGELFGGIAGARRAYRAAQADGDDNGAKVIADFMQALKREGLINVDDGERARAAKAQKTHSGIGFIREKRTTGLAIGTASPVVQTERDD